ncbi:G-type lectin S-receptor-like serine/threonine-protein kinase SD1-1 [Pyrus ussuriensis x Pyrus communis]|uniref:G-type lectin S-receptor-like serine/threonine-protein kinase SD1-1 n=1 Tax=Pyrus ussuriensis x Pyrus communis TaxID=2448454 RepID=A0A5N5I8Z3_9ROSA|nr:G-type lectin S-receptor-like serine/threonine-protein kinase SD1-1 [Pyrus ussuriensis x Pyrus communis]
MIRLETDAVNQFGGGVVPQPQEEQRNVFEIRSDRNFSKHTSKSKGFLRQRGALAIPIVSVLLALVLIIVFAYWRRKKKSKTKDYTEIDELEEARRHPKLQYFSLSTIIAATDNFSPINKLGQGGFGIVYKSAVLEPAMQGRDLIGCT